MPAVDDDRAIIARWDHYLHEWALVMRGGYPGLANGSDRPDGNHHLAEYVEAAMRELWLERRLLWEALRHYYLCGWDEHETGGRHMGEWLRHQFRGQWTAQDGMTDEQRAYRTLDRARLALELVATARPSKYTAGSCRQVAPGI